jgi:hypothetical protein
MPFMEKSISSNLRWERFWCPREGTVRMDWDGFVLPPEAELAHYLKTDVVPAEELHPVPCLILLGEPGMGKSHEIGRMAAEVQGDVAIIRDLRKYDSTMALRADLEWLPRSRGPDLPDEPRTRMARFQGVDYYDVDSAWTAAAEVHLGVTSGYLHSIRAVRRQPFAARSACH